MTDRISRISEEIIKTVGGEANIVNFENCMTRLRIMLKDRTLFCKDDLAKVDGVMGILHSGSQIQIIIGPGIASKVSDYIKENTSIYVEDAIELGDAKSVKKD